MQEGPAGARASVPDAPSAAVGGGVPLERLCLSAGLGMSKYSPMS